MGGRRRRYRDLRAGTGSGSKGVDELPQSLPGPDNELGRLSDDEIVGFRGFPFGRNNRDSVVSSSHLGQVVSGSVETRGFERVPIEVDLETEFLLNVLADQESENLTRDDGDFDETGVSPQEGGHSILAVRYETTAISEAESLALGLGRDVFAPTERLKSLHELFVPNVAADRFVTRAVGSTSIRIIDGGDLTRLGFENVIGDHSVVRVIVARRRVRPTANASIQQVRT